MLKNQARICTAAGRYLALLSQTVDKPNCCYQPHPIALHALGLLVLKVFRHMASGGQCFPLTPHMGFALDTFGLWQEFFSALRRQGGLSPCCQTVKEPFVLATALLAACGGIAMILTASPFRTLGL